MTFYVVFFEAHIKITCLANFQKKTMLLLVLTWIQSSKKVKNAKTCQKLRFFQKFYFLPEVIKYFKLTENVEKKIFDPYPILPQGLNGNLGSKRKFFFNSMTIFFSFRVCLVTKTTIKMEDNILEFLISPFENGLCKQICSCRLKKNYFSIPNSHLDPRVRSDRKFFFNIFCQLEMFYHFWQKIKFLKKS